MSIQEVPGFDPATNPHFNCGIGAFGMQTARAMWVIGDKAYIVDGDGFILMALMVPHHERNVYYFNKNHEEDKRRVEMVREVPGLENLNVAGGWVPNDDIPVVADNQLF